MRCFGWATMKRKYGKLILNERANTAPGVPVRAGEPQERPGQGRSPSISEHLCASQCLSVGLLEQICSNFKLYNRLFPMLCRDGPYLISLIIIRAHVTFLFLIKEVKI